MKRQLAICKFLILENGATAPATNGNSSVASQVPIQQGFYIGAINVMPRSLYTPSDRSTSVIRALILEICYSRGIIEILWYARTSPKWNGDNADKSSTVSIECFIYILYIQIVQSTTCMPFRLHRSEEVSLDLKRNGPDAAGQASLAQS